MNQPGCHVSVCEDVTLVFDVSRFVSELEDFFRHFFDGENFTGISFPNKEYLPESTSPDQGQDLDGKRERERIETNTHRLKEKQTENL